MVTRPFLHGVLLAFALLFLCSCSSTRLITSWSDSTVQGYSLKKPLIISIVPKPLVRKKLEDGFVESLKAIGIDAVASYTLFPEIADLAPERIKSRLPALGFDSMLVARLLDVKRETVHVPARTEVYATGGMYGRPAYYNSYGGYYANSFNVVSTPAYNYIEKSYVAETNIYDVQEGKLIWTGATETEDTGSMEAAITGFTKVLLKDIRAKSIF